MELTLDLRLATRDDIGAMVPLINRAYRVEDFFLHGDRTSEADLAARMSLPGAAFLLLVEPGRVCGAIFVQVKGDRGFFGMLAVDPSLQKQGLGRTLIRAAEDHCREQGCRFLDLDVVSVRPELPPFYRSLGFTPYDTEPFHHPENLKRPVHLILMTKPLVDLWAERDTRS